MDMISWYPYHCNVTKLNTVLEDEEVSFKGFSNSF